MSWNMVCTDKDLSGTTWLSKIIGLRDKMTKHSLEVDVSSGAGSLAITPWTSISGRRWMKETQLVTGFGAGSGPNSDGLEIFTVILEPAESIYFEVVATGAAVFNLWFTQK